MQAVTIIMVIAAFTLVAVAAIAGCYAAYCALEAHREKRAKEKSLRDWHRYRDHHHENVE